MRWQALVILYHLLNVYGPLPFGTPNYIAVCEQKFTKFGLYVLD